MGVLDIARTRVHRQVTLARRATVQATRMWAGIDPRRIADSWAGILPALATVVESAQLIAAAGAGVYLDDLLDAYRLDAGSDYRVRPERFAGAASDGRDLSSLLYQPAISTLTALKKGATERRALVVGRALVERIVRTQVADAGRVADSVALVARPQLTGYVRMLTTPSCARCVLLAGRVYRWNDGFARHDVCDCRHIPAREDVAGDLATDPGAYFRSLSTEEQDRLFTKAGAQAIRDGADIGRVINARRGMSTASSGRLARRQVGDRKLATTTEATRRAVRLMPESVYEIAGDDRAEALRLLRVHGYIVPA